MQDLIDQLLNTSAPLLKMRRSPEPRAWAVNLKTLAAAPELAPFRNILVSVASNGFGKFESLNQFFQNEAGKIDERVCGAAMLRVEDAIAENSYSALVVAVVVLKTWTIVLGDQLYRQGGGMPPQGWTFFPLVCARAALKAGAVDSAVKIVDRAVDVLNAARYRDSDAWQSAMAEYRALAREAESRWRMAVEDLAGDLQASCRTEDPNFRAEFAALLWTLGMLPESLLMRADPSLPPLGLFRQAVRISLHSIPNDPLLQYVWLEFKDRGPFNIRDHSAFFGIIDLDYPSSPMLLDDFMDISPSRLYAQTLIAWMRGTLTEDLAGRYVSHYHLIHDLFPECDWTVYIRMNMLAWMVSKQFGHLKRNDAAAERAWLEDLTAKASSLNRNLQAHPNWPQIYARSTGPMFWLIENLAGQGLDADLLPALENFRMGGLTYAMLASPPCPLAEEARAAAELLEKERELIKDLKGCFFLLLNPLLPSHYQHYDVDLRDPVLMRGLDFKGAPEAYTRTRKELTELHKSMAPAAPRYAERRLNPGADSARLAEALRSHR